MQHYFVSDYPAAMCIRGQLFSLSKSLLVRLVYSGFNEAQDNATKRQENEGNVAVYYILKHHRKTTRQIKRKRKQQIVIGTRKLSDFLTTTSSFMTFVEFHEISIFSSALQIADLVSISTIVSAGQSCLVVYFCRQRDL